MSAVMEESVAAKQIGVEGSAKPQSRPMTVRHVTHGVDAGPLQGTRPSRRQAYVRGIIDGVRDTIFCRRGGFWTGTSRR